MVHDELVKGLLEKMQKIKTKKKVTGVTTIT